MKKLLNIKLILYLFIVFLFGTQKLSAQTIDELLTEVEVTKSDTHELSLLVKCSDISDIPDIPLYSNQAIDLAKELIQHNKATKHVYYNYGMAINNMGFYYNYIGQNDSSKFYYYLALDIFKEQNLLESEALIYNNLASIFVDEGDTDSSLSVLKKAEEICLNNKYFETLTPVYSNYTSFFYKTGDILKAIEYTEKNIKLQEEINSAEGLLHSYNSMSAFYLFLNDYQKAEEYSLKIFEYLDNEYDENTHTVHAYHLATYYLNLGMIRNYLGKDSLKYANTFEGLRYAKSSNYSSKIGSAYVNLHQYFSTDGFIDKAFMYLDSAEQIYSSTEDINGLADVYATKAEFFFNHGNDIKAKYFGELSLKYANKANIPKTFKKTSFVLSKIYYKQNNYQKAYKMLELYHELKDSLENVDKQKSIYKSQIDIEYNQKVFKDSIENAKQKEISQLKINEQNAQIEKEHARNTTLIIGLFGLIVLVGFVIRAYAKKRELVNAIKKQKEIVEEKNKEITDSINYASKIQQAILTSKEYLNNILNKYFILYKPKDIVSGDFYWVYKTNTNKTIIAVVDCTGHGVPGAFMSMIGNSLLNEIIIENKIQDAKDILNKLREGVIKSLSQSGDDNNQKDGMDMSLCIYDEDLKTIEFSGANNGVWIVTKTNQTKDIPEHKKSILVDNNLMLIDIKGNKFPIGKHHGDLQPFESFSYQLSKGDIFYMSTDGFADQFGGINNKKYKYKNFKKFLMSIHDLPIEQQQKELNKEFEKWKGVNEQLDDLCVFALKV